MNKGIVNRGLTELGSSLCLLKEVLIQMLLGPEQCEYLISWYLSGGTFL